MIADWRLNNISIIVSTDELVDNPEMVGDSPRQFNSGWQQVEYYPGKLGGMTTKEFTDSVPVRHLAIYKCCTHTLTLVEVYVWGCGKFILTPISDSTCKQV